MANKIPRLVNPIAVALLLFGFAFIGYEIYRDRMQRDADMQRAAQLQKIEQHTAALKQAADNLNEQAAHLSEQTDRMQQQVQQEKRDAEAARQRFITAANLAEGMQAASFAETAIAEFYLTEGRFPKNNSEIGMQPPEAYGGHSLRSIALSEGGVMTLTYNDKADKGAIRLIPEDADQQGRINWRCVTASYANIATILPSCEYSKARAKDAAVTR